MSWHSRVLTCVRCQNIHEVGVAGGCSGLCTERAQQRALLGAAGRGVHTTAQSARHVHRCQAHTARARMHQHLPAHGHLNIRGKL